MKLQRIEWFPLRFGLQPALVIKGEQLSERHGVALRITGDDGVVGWGECSPLPGYSVETLPEAEAAVKEQVARQQGRSIDVSSVTNGLSLAECLDMDDAPASVRFAFECALLNLMAQVKGQAPEEVLAVAVPQSHVRVNALIVPGPQDLRPAVDAALLEGTTSLKIKVGRGAPADDIAMLTEVVSATQGRAEIRLDANRGWSLEEAKQVLSTFSPDTFEYVEEPLARLQDYAALSEAVDTPLALDESLVTLSLEQLDAMPFVDSLVVKPSLLGGLSRAWFWFDVAERKGMKTVVSSLFESGLGMVPLIQLAAAMQVGDTCMGFDTYRWIQNDVLSQPILMREGRIDLESLPACQVDLAREETAHGND